MSATGNAADSEHPRGPATDLSGRECPAGDWAAPGCRLVPMIEAWPGMMLARDPAD